MNTTTIHTANFIAASALITYRDVKNPDPTWPLGRVPPPYRYVAAGVVFGLLAGVGELFNISEVTAVLGIGLVLGLAVQTFQQLATSNQTPQAPQPPAQTPSPNLK